MIRRSILLCLGLCLIGCGEFRSPGAKPTTAPAPGVNEPLGDEKPALKAGELRAGVAKVEITNKKSLPFNDPLYVKALVLKSADTTAVLVTLDAVSIGEIGYIGNDYLGKV